MTFSASREDRVGSHYQDNYRPSFGASPPRSLFKITAFAIMLLGAGAGGVWYWMQRPHTLQTGNIPVVKAQPGPIKIHPDDHQQMVKQEMIYERLDKVVSSTPQIEHILPPPETPISRIASTENPVISSNDGQEVTEIEAIQSPINESESEIDRLSHKYGHHDDDSEPATPTNVATIPDVEKVTNEMPTSDMVSIDDIFSKVAGEEAIDDVTETPQYVDVADKTPPPATNASVSKGDFTLQLGSFPQKEHAEAEKKRVTKALGAGYPVSMKKTDKGIYRLAGGSFRTKEEAIKKCQALKQKKIDCMVVKRSKE